MSLTSAVEYRELLSFFANESAASNIVSLGLSQLNDSATPSFAFISDMVAFNFSTSNTTMVNYNDAVSGTLNAINANSSSSGGSMGSVGGGGGGGVRHRPSMATGKPRISTEMPIWLIPCYSIILFFAIIGNLLVISTLVQNRRMRTITNLFLLNLAISDILLGVLCMPVTLVGTLLRHFIFGEFFCKLIQFSQAISVAVSSWTLVAISCERYYAICHPLRSRTWQTLNHAYRIIAFIWFGSIVCMTPIAVFSQLMPTSRQGLRKCREHWPKDSLGYERAYNIFLDLVLLVLPLMILCFAYILITRTLYIGMKNERAMIFGSSCGKVGSEVDALTSALTTPTVQTTTSGFQFNMSFRTRGRGYDMGRSETCGNAGGNGASDVNPPARHKSKSRHHHQQQQQQQQQQQYYDDYTQSTHKRKLLTATDGRRHLYCMRTASVKSLNHNNNDRGGTSPSPSMTVINVPQQQRFKLYQHRQQQQQQQQQPSYNDNESRKANSTPSLRLGADTALRRSNKTKSLESKKRVIKMLFVLVLEFFICWTPLYVINTVAMFIGNTIYEYIDYTSISFFQLLAYSSSCCNPITYCFMNAGFRRAFLDTFKGMQLSGTLFGRKSSPNHSVAGNSIILANSTTMMTTHTILDSPRL